MKKHTIILDAAHGIEVPGKRSPDGKFREYKWSRDIIKLLIPKLQAQGYEVFQSNPTDNEVGLSNRSKAANSINRPNKLFISLHVNAAGDGSKWLNARGYSIYTTKGNNNSDILAECIMKQLALNFPELTARVDKSDKDLDIEENFTVLVKTNCPSVLLEWLFQDNKADVTILNDPNYNNKLVDTLISAINTVDNLL